MPSSKSPQTIFIPLRLGRASDYDPAIFPLTRKKTALKKGELYLQSTMDELVRIYEMSEHRYDFKMIFEQTKLGYDL